jgi:imidazole glycerol-phosphate synthase subunit HisF
MLRPRVIPVLLLNDNGLVKTFRFSKPKYVGDPINAVRIFNDKGTDELVFLDISASNQKRKPDFGLIGEICSEAFMPFAYGGGINTMNDIEELFKLGIEKVILNTCFYSNPELVRQAASVFGSQSIIVSIDYRKNIFGRSNVYISCGKIKTKYEPVDYAKKAEDYGSGEIMLNCIDRDGAMKGYDIEEVKKVSDSLEIPVVACGGAGSLEDMRNVLTYGHASAAAAGSMFVFTGPHKAVLISYPTENEIENLI